ncbi:hypothetical protein DY245_18785 [Streptomyces inhibens]|uniref:Uncharacterized protein n=1 Tax=Streptomyces inhibens TaxID=2293571 RepID=A0A371Q2G4_STRIH|nr:hypothetical protein [Streptomyces inhibens]REK88908.1 hypothetical protein DY245_18785 [Streptomyces inhibens]
MPLRTRVTARRAVGSTALALTSGPPLFRTRLAPAAQAAGRHDDGHVLDRMHAGSTAASNDERILSR